MVGMTYQRLKPMLKRLAFIKRHWLLTLFLLFILWIAHKVYRFFVYVDPGSVMVTSVSSDGHYAVTSDSLKRIILWDLQRHKARLIANKANIYSAYFIKHSDKFIWQDLAHNRVYVEDVQDHIIKSFQPGFATYGEIMTTDLQTYFASDQAWNLYSCKQGGCKVIKRAYDVNGFLGEQKLLNLYLSSDDKFLLTSGSGSYFDDIPLSAGINNGQALKKGYKVERINWESLLEGIVLWSVMTGKPLVKYPGNKVKEVAAISPDDKYIVGGDEQPLAFVWDLQSGKRLFQLDFIKYGHIVNPKAPIDKQRFDKTGLIPQPKDYGYCLGFRRDMDEKINGSIFLAAKFIDKTHYLRLVFDTPWAVLYQVTNPQPSKYLFLGKDPYPAMSDFSADESLDTSSQAHVLVTGQYNHDGIIVYHYDPKAQTLTRVWAPSAPSFLARWFWV